MTVARVSKRESDFGFQSEVMVLGDAGEFSRVILMNDNHILALFGEDAFGKTFRIVDGKAL